MPRANPPVRRKKRWAERGEHLASRPNTSVSRSADQHRLSHTSVMDGRAIRDREPCIRSQDGAKALLQVVFSSFGFVPRARTPNATLRELRIGSGRVTFGEPLFQTVEIADPLVNAQAARGRSSSQPRISQSPSHFPASQQIHPASLFRSENPGPRAQPLGSRPDSQTSASQTLEFSA